MVDQAVASQRIHAGDEVTQIVANDEIDAMFLEGFDGRRRPCPAPALENSAPVLAGHVGVLFRS